MAVSGEDSQDIFCNWTVSVLEMRRASKAAGKSTQAKQIVMFFHLLVFLQRKKIMINIILFEVECEFFGFGQEMGAFEFQS
jgi:hypothetical protein